MIFAALHVFLAYQGHSFEREEPRYFQQGFQVTCFVRGYPASRTGAASKLCRAYDFVRFYWRQFDIIRT